MSIARRTCLIQTLILLILIACIVFPVTSIRLYKEKPSNESSSVTLPWVGVIRVRPNGSNKEAVTGIIMIARHWAAGNANEISKINKKYLRNITQAIFYRPDGFPWQCSVEKYIIHPEYDKKTLNTIALVKMKYKLDHFPWRIIRWPLGRLDLPSDVFAIGFTDRENVLNQVKYKMEYVNETNCKDFYKKEKIDFKSMWPVSFSCYTRKYSKNTCVYDAGMALATKSSGMWTLLGISTLGPGCALPARFIDFFHYVPWIEGKVGPRSAGGRRQAQGMYRIWQDADKVLLNKLYTNELAMRPYTYGTDTVYGRCTGDDGDLVYRDKIAITVDDLDTRGYGVAIFALTIYDLFYRDFTCISLRSFCRQRSRPGFYFSYGFRQEDVDRFTKRVPFTMFPDRIPVPRIHTLFSRWADYDYIRTAWFEVKFQFQYYGFLELKIYGPHYERTTPTTTTTMKLTSSRPRTTHTYMERWRPSPPTTPDDRPTGKPPGPEDDIPPG